MAFELETIKQIPSNERAAYASIVAVQQVVASARQCIEIVDAAVMRAPDGAEGLLDALCQRSEGVIKCQQFYDLYARSLEVVNLYKQDDDDKNEEAKITSKQLEAAIARVA